MALLLALLVKAVVFLGKPVGLLADKNNNLD